MASTVDISAHLESFDFLGCQGSDIHDRVNILVTFEKVLLTETKLTIECCQFSPEGYGKDMFWCDKVFIPQDRPLQTQTVLWTQQRQLPQFHKKLILRNVINLDVNQINYIVYEQTVLMPLVAKEAMDYPKDDLVLLELFGGGYGGWKCAADFINVFTPSGNIRSVSVEHDHHAAMSYALSNHTGFVLPQEELPPDFFTCNNRDWVVCDDVHSPKWLSAIAHLGVDAVSISSPCPPWTAANDSPGLGSEDGHSILSCRFLRPLMICIEQVANIAGHAHREIIAKAINWIGFKVIFQRTVNITEVLGNHRPRWFAVAVRVHAPVPHEKVSYWVTSELTIPTRSVTFKCWLNETKKSMELSPDAVEVASNPRLTWNPTKAREQTFRDRIHSSDAVVPTFMRMYGQQHLLKSGFLESYKFYGHYLKDEECDNSCRHWHPTEITLKHGLTNQCFHPDNLHQAWQIQGNVVTAIQVLPLLVACANSHRTQKIDVQQITQKYLDTCWTAEDTCFQKVSGGYFMSLLSEPIKQSQLEVYESLIHMLQSTDPQHIVWIPDCDDHSSNPPGQCEATLVSLPTPSDEEEIPATSTISFGVVMKARILLEGSEQYFWFSAELPFDMLVKPWDSLYHPQTLDLQDTAQPSVELRYNLDRVITEEGNTSHVLHMLDDNALTLLKIPKALPVIQHPALVSIATPCDQFGYLPPDKVADDNMLVLPRPLPQVPTSTMPVMLAAAFPDCKVTWVWNPMNDHLIVGIKGPNIPRQTVADFWASVLSADILKILGRQVTVQSSAHQLLVIFQPSRQEGVCPHGPFQIALVATATQALLDVITRTDGPSMPVILKWNGSKLWSGRMPPQFTVAMCQQLLRIAMHPVIGATQPGILHRKSLLASATDFSFLAQSSPSQATEFEVQTAADRVLRLTGGGGPAKQQQRLCQQSALAATLLEQGFDLTWTTDTVDKLMSKYGIGKLQSITSQPMGGPRVKSILALCEEARITVPKVAKPVAYHAFEGAPWKSRKKRQEDKPIDVTEFEICPGFFHSEDGSQLSQMMDIRPHESGICLMAAQQAVPWLQSSQKTSADELAILTIGKLPCNTDLETKELRFPCYNRSKQMVLLTGHITQLGSKKVCWSKGDKQMIDTEECTLVALTAYKTDFNPDTWLDLTLRTMPTFRKLLANDDMDVLQSVWGKSLRNGRMQASPQQATSVQVHASIPTSGLDDFLRKSGFNRVFCTPKLSTGRLSLQYRVVWSNVEPAQAAIQAAKITGCLGLVKGKTSLGFRVKAEDHSTAWSSLHPGVPPPNKPGGDLVFKALGLPFGVTASSMQKWLDTVGWCATPFKAIGPTAYLLRAETQPPQGIHMFNGSPILLQFLPERENNKQPLVLGPRGAIQGNIDPLQQPGQDPWANSQLGGPASSSRTLTGPTELRFQAQDDKIQALQTEMTKMAKNTEQLREDTKKQFEHMEQRTNEQFSVVSSAMTQLRDEVDRSLKLSWQQNTHMMDSRMQELRQLIQRKPKRGHDEADDSDMDG